ncbi:hypothetical protein [Chryseobacterium sp. 22458]|uniref:hypothetical protein n=1 Tax=Chryseobacterium sp. 22458 TaxID=3453921 RepID=UPI003F8515FA
MKISYLGAGIVGTALVLALSSNVVFAKKSLKPVFEKVNANSDSLKIEGLAKDLKKLKPLGSDEFKRKFKKEINGYKLTEVTASEDNETGSFATGNYAKAGKNIYLMVADGAGAGAEQVKSSLLNYLETKKYEEPGDKTNIKSYKGWQVYFDYSMFESDQHTSIQYLEGNRYSVVSSGNNVPIDELKSFLDNFSL